LGQDPAGGTRVEVGSEVTITVGTAPPEATTTIGTVSPGATTTIDTASPEATTQAEPQSVPFDDNFSDISSGWVDNNLGQYSDGGYLLDTGDQRYIYVPSPVERIKDAIVEVVAYDVTIDPTGTNYWGVACRFVDINNFYSLEITNTGKYDIVKYSDGEAEILDRGERKGVIDPKAPNRIRADCVGNTLTLYVNGQKLVETTDTEFSSGYIGLYAKDGLTPSGKDGPAPVEVWFDNFKARKP